MGELIPLLRHLEQSRFYGSVELKYEAGRVVLIRKSETFIVTGEGACNTVLFRPSSTASCVNKQARAIASSSCRPSIPSFMSRSQTTWSLVMVARFLSKHPIDSRVPDQRKRCPGEFVRSASHAARTLFPLGSRVDKFGKTLLKPLKNCYLSTFQE
jgi:hypothetical protein